MLKLTSKDKIILEDMLDTACTIVGHYDPELDADLLEEADAIGRTVRRMLDHPEEFNKDTVIPRRKDFIDWFRSSKHILGL